MNVKLILLKLRMKYQKETIKFLIDQRVLNKNKNSKKQKICKKNINFSTFAF